VEINVMANTPDKWTDGSAYEMYVGRWSRQIGKKFLAWLEPPADSRWLELGCGTGALTSQILAHCSPRSVIAIDPSEEFLAVARRQLNHPRAEFRQGSGAQLPVQDDEVDWAVSGFVLNFIDDQPQALQELARAVVPGGTIAAYVWDYAGHVQFMRYFWNAAVALNPAARDKDEGIRFPICRPGPLRALFEAAGLSDVEVEAIDIPTPFQDFADYWTPFLSGVGPAPGYCASLDEAAREELKLRLQETLPTDPDGMILLAARAWAVRGTCRGSA
jgi:SAM-dependent methyltransferase